MINYPYPLYENIASAATITIAPGYDYITITGTTAITAINGLFEKREIRIQTPSATPFTASATVGNTITATAGGLLLGVVIGGKLYLR